MRVWLIQTGEPVPLFEDVKRMRTALLADELAARGHEVVWWASSFDHRSRSFIARGGTVRQVGKGVHVQLLPALGYRRAVSLRRYLDHRYVASSFRRALGDCLDQPDLVVAATPDYHIAADAAEYADGRGIPYIIDIRDSWPDSFVDHVPTRWGKAMARGILGADFAKVRGMLRGASGLVAMMDSLLEWGLAQTGKAKGVRDRVFFLGTEALPPPNPDFLAHLRQIVGRDGRTVVVYVGTFGRYNHPGLIVDALRVIETQGKDRPFDVVIGGGGDLYQQVRDRAVGLSGVHFTGWLQADQISAVLSLGSLGVVPWAQGAAFPNKAFSYFEAGLPVLTSASGDLKQIVEEEGVGEFYPPGDAGQLAEALTRLATDGAGLRAMAERVRVLYPLRFRADGIYRDYAEYLEHVATL